jgi:hypothetical protein
MHETCKDVLTVSIFSNLSIIQFQMIVLKLFLLKLSVLSNAEWGNSIIKKHIFYHKYSEAEI